MPDWPVEKLGDLVDASRGISYGIVQPGEHQPDGIPIVRVSDLKGDSVETGKPLRVASSIEAAHSRTRLRGGELIMSIVGTVGQTAIVDSSLEGWNVARAVAVIPVKRDIGPYWIRLALKGGPARVHIQDRLNTTVQATLNLRDLASLPIVMPPAPEREAIAATLGALDDKIELNRKMNATLEAMARALFRDWFVDFGPTRARMEARAPTLSPDLWPLFPDRLDAEGKPEGWEIRPLVDCFNLLMGQSPPGDTYNETGDGLPFFQGRTDFGFRFPENRKYCSAPTRVAETGDTLVSVRAPVGDINLALERCCIGRGVAALRHKGGSASFTYYTAWSLQDELRQYENTGTVFGAINKKQFEALPTINPGPAVIEAFEEIVSALDSRIESNERESRTLAQTRDLLLPKLMSGELRVADSFELETA